MSSALSPQIKEAFTKLGQYLRSCEDDQLIRLIENAKHYNAWFTPGQTEKAVRSIGNMLSGPAISTWFENEKQKLLSPGISGDQADIRRQNTGQLRTVGLILAGNIPLVGFHDILCVLASGHTALIKLSSQDKYLTPYILEKLIEFEPSLSARIIYTERLENFDAVIATGSNNSSRYFEYYFSKVPHIIRKNRNSVAILTGNESEDQLKALGNDIFDYFGLGCRNVSKLYVPKGYVFNTFFESIESFKSISDHHKYNNNYDYNKSVFLVNQEPHLDNGFLLLKPVGENDTSLSSPLATLYYEEYNDIQSLYFSLLERSSEIQCVVSNSRPDLPNQWVNFGETQRPELWDYADGINTMQFLLSLS